MIRRSLIPLFALLLALALPACGSSSASTSAGGTTSGGDQTAASTTASTEGGSGTAERPQSTGVALKQIGKFEAPVYIAGAPGFPKLLFVVEQPGRIAVLKNGKRLGKPFLDISSQISYEGERGLLSVAFPPDYAQSKRFYVYYTTPAGNIRIDEFKRASSDRGAIPPATAR